MVPSISLAATHEMWTSALQWTIRNNKATVGEGLGCHIRRNSCPLCSSPCMAFLLLDKIISVTFKGLSNPELDNKFASVSSFLPLYPTRFAVFHQEGRRTMSYRHLIDAFTPFPRIRQRSPHPCYRLQSPQPSAAPASPVSTLWQPWTALQGPASSNSPGATPSKPRSLPALSRDPCLLILGMAGQHNVTEQ